MGEFGKIAETIPENWTNDQQMKGDVLFLWEDVDEKTVLDGLTVKPDIGRVITYLVRFFGQSTGIKSTRSGLMKICGSCALSACHHP